MQITRAAGLDFSASKGFPRFYDEQLLEPELNVEIGCWYLKHSLDLYRNSPDPVLFALLRYNAGESRADAWLRIALASRPPAGMSIENHYLTQVDFPKTRTYARRILKRFRSRNYLF
jgi:soluble lytic murein transglycosylase